jgi:tetratricopeptide (TPR) repeat protein
MEILLPAFRAARLALESDGAAASMESDSSENMAAGLDRAILDAVLPRLAPHLMGLETLMNDEAVPRAEDRLKAVELWEALKALSAGRRRLAVERERRYWNWALAERLCEESLRAAAHRADEGVDLTRLALRVAELTPGDEAWRSRLHGWVWAFVANARRVQGDLLGADEGFLHADRLATTGTTAIPDLLDEARPLGLKASLRRHQGRFDEALTLLEQALKTSNSNVARGQTLINKANTLKRMGDLERSLADLRQAELLLKGSQDVRDTWLVQQSLVHTLWQLGRFTEAEARLPEVRRRALATGNELDLIRTLWVEGGVAAGLGRRAQAIAALEQVRGYFHANRIAYDAALASLELAVFYLEEERITEVQALAEEMFWIFKSQGVHQEAIAALRLFYEAARKDEATAELARRLHEYLTKARCSPGLWFEFQESP